MKKIMMTNNEETKTIENCHIDAVSHFEISASCPILWSKYPTMQQMKKTRDNLISILIILKKCI